jgi:CubicO group peptidase (beta-lactamase class C family)
MELNNRSAGERLMSKSVSSLGQQNKGGLTEGVKAALEDWLPEQLGKFEIPGAAVAVVDKRGVIWGRSFGHLDHPDSPRVESDTLFGVRSLAKGVTAIAVLVAVQDGLVGLDTPIKEYLPAFTVHSRFEPHPEEIITLRHLLAHWAGFTHDAPLGNNLDDPDYDLDAPDYFEKHIESISDTWMRFPVGYRYAYTNLGYDLAGYILQVCSGMPFPQYVKEKVLDRIGMKRSSYDMDLIERSGNRAIGHASNGKIKPLRCPEMPAAGLYANVPDMAKYIQFHLGNGTIGGVQVLSQDLMRQYHTGASPKL